ncbi:radical SAM protein [Sulfurisphaera javensis]|uniref:radical SAM protein n=1 Tax=Sulfurisphaera javensis TaxID=2049879 RepID=UPI0034E87B0A
MRLEKVTEPIPLIGHIAFGIIDRGTNMLQVRPFSNCPMSCIFCSVDAGPKSRSRVTEYIVDADYLIEWVNYVVQKKIHQVSILIDGVGEPILHPDIIKIVKGIRENKKVFEIAVETHGLPLTERLVKGLANAGLDRINLSLDSLDESKAKYLSGHQGYNVSNILRIVDIALNEGIKIMLTPVWIKGINDEDIINIVKYGKEKGLFFGIQKYVEHPRGRKIGKEVSWKEFSEFLSEIEKMLDVNLFLSPSQFKIYPDVRLGPVFEIGEKVIGEIVLDGWMKNEVIISARNRVITVVGVNNIPKGVSMKVRITRNKDEIYLAKIS